MGRLASHLSSLIHRLDRLDSKEEKVFQGAGTLTGRLVHAMRANMVMKNRDVGINRIAAHGLNSLYKASQIQLDSTALPKWRAGRAAGRSFDTLRAHVLSNLIEVILEIWFRDHG